jgi:hypothetical protein
MQERVDDVEAESGPLTDEEREAAGATIIDWNG